MMTRAMRWHEVLCRLPDGEPVTMAEIGVWRGDLSRRLLSRRKRLHLLLVDPWRTAEAGTSWADSRSRMTTIPQRTFDEALAGVEAIAAQHPGRATILRMPSVEAAREVTDQSLHAAFLDGDHSYEGLRGDIAAWLPKVRTGGWIGGHDFGAHRFPGVRRAVEEAFTAADVEIGGDHTWFARIPA